MINRVIDVLPKGAWGLLKMISAKTAYSFLILIAIFTGCSNADKALPSLVVQEGLRGGFISAGPISPKGEIVPLSDDSLIFLQNRGGIRYYSVEGTFSKESFS